MAVSMVLRRMEASDLDSVLELWSRSEGLTLRTIDSPRHLERFLERNPGLSQVAMREGRIVGAVICGHDGRRGYLHHLAVAPEVRRLGIGTSLAKACAAALTDIGITKCHLFVRADNPDASAFWSGTGWAPRTDIAIFSRMLTDDPND